MENTFIDTRPIFTRYLYYKNHVVISLNTSLLKKEPEKAIFWAYELYFSGFQKELFSIILIFYNTYYNSEEINSDVFILEARWSRRRNRCDKLRRCSRSSLDDSLSDIPKIEKMRTFIESKIEEWNKNNFKHYLVATIVHTLACFNSPTTLGIQKVISKIIKPNIIILYNTKDIEEYKTKKVTPTLSTTTPKILHYRFLQTACIYYTEKIVDLNLFGSLDIFKPYITEDKDLKNKYFYNWEFYSFFTPIWKERIEKFGGSINYEFKRIEFYNEEGEERFYNEYGYEPDEQPIEITMRTIG